MSIRRPTQDQLWEIAERLGFEFDEDELGAYHEIIAGSMDVFDVMDELPDIRKEFPIEKGYTVDW